MKGKIKIEDLEASYIAHLENSTVADVYGGGFFDEVGDAIGDAIRTVYKAGKKTGRYIAKACGY